MADLMVSAVKEIDHVEYQKRRSGSLYKIKSVWSSIIEKYSQFDEEDQGDLIDLATGKIIDDTGHVKSMNGTLSVWHDYLDQEERAVASQESRYKRGKYKPQSVSIDLLADSDYEEDEDEGRIFKDPLPAITRSQRERISHVVESSVPATPSKFKSVSTDLIPTTPMTSRKLMALKRISLESDGDSLIPTTPRTSIAKKRLPALTPRRKQELSHDLIPARERVLPVVVNGMLPQMKSVQTPRKPRDIVHLTQDDEEREVAVTPRSRGRPRKSVQTSNDLIPRPRRGRPPKLPVVDNDTVPVTPRRGRPPKALTSTPKTSNRRSRALPQTPVTSRKIFEPQTPKDKQIPEMGLIPMTPMSLAKRDSLLRTVQRSKCLPSNDLIPVTPGRSPAVAYLLKQRRSQKLLNASSSNTRLKQKQREEEERRCDGSPERSAAGSDEILTGFARPKKFRRLYQKEQIDLVSARPADMTQLFENRVRTVERMKSRVRDSVVRDSSVFYSP